MCSVIYSQLALPAVDQQCSWTESNARAQRIDRHWNVRRWLASISRVTLNCVLQNSFIIPWTGRMPNAHSKDRMRKQPCILLVISTLTSHPPWRKESCWGAINSTVCFFQLNSKTRATGCARFCRVMGGILVPLSNGRPRGPLNSLHTYAFLQKSVGLAWLCCADIGLQLAMRGGSVLCTVIGTRGTNQIEARRSRERPLAPHGRRYSPS